MFDIQDLYLQVIVDHNKSPRNFGRLDGANRKVEGYNPLCGDKLTLFMRVDAGNRIDGISFEGSGCAISIASASLMTEKVKGLPAKEAEEIFQHFHDMVISDVGEAVDDETLGKLSVFSGVREFPSRIKCATLCWHTMHTAIENGATVVSTEGGKDDFE
ncbi:MAG: Fe-S cluster assembly sulfur transfer protein SufU [Mariprofundaceae bacterium]